MLDKEKLRELFGRSGDINDHLAKEYGTAYLDHPDDTRENIPEEFKKIGNVIRINGIIRRQLEAAPEIDCRTSQGIMLDYLKKYISGDPIPFTVELTEKFAAVFKHLFECGNSGCQKLDNIAHLDKYLTPDEMKVSYGEEIDNWKITED